MGHGFSYGAVLATVFSHPRVTILWAAWLGFCVFCVASWSLWSIHDTLKYAPAAFLLLFASTLSGLRSLQPKQ